ncbi:CHAD domain-containing protein [Liquorilactobacillus ghanensis]|uniref:CHAD domain-containing protein n=1 Tax=Liquorilactobacillus ghanensis TaxID=399370 RepID=UPI0039ED74FD
MMTSILTILQQRSTAIQTELIRFRNNPYDPNRAHDLRVAIRTLRSLLKFLKPQLDSATFNELDQTLSEAAQTFGPLRELDVLLAEIGSYAFEHPQENTVYFQLLKKLHHKRTAEMQRILTPAVWHKLTSKLTAADIQLNQLKFNQTKKWSQSVNYELTRRSKKLSWQFRQIDPAQYQQTHQLRKKAKTLRYAAIYFVKFAPKKAKKSRRQAEKIQNVCGVVTDAHVNATLLQNLAQQTDNSAEKQLLVEIKQTQQKSFHLKK